MIHHLINIGISKWSNGSESSYLWFSAGQKNLWQNSKNPVYK